MQSLVTAILRRAQRVPLVPLFAGAWPADHSYVVRRFALLRVRRDRGGLGQRYCTSRGFDVAGVGTVASGAAAAAAGLEGSQIDIAGCRVGKRRRAASRVHTAEARMASTTGVA